MARPPSDDPLLTISLRIPASLREALDAQAQASGATLSDVLRAHLTLAAAKPLAKPRPRRRLPQLAPSASVDPVAMRQFAGIRNNLNQITYAINATRAAGGAVDWRSVFDLLHDIDRQVHVAVQTLLAS